MSQPEVQCIHECNNCGTVFDETDDVCPGCGSNEDLLLRLRCGSCGQMLEEATCIKCVPPAPPRTPTRTPTHSVPSSATDPRFKSLPTIALVCGVTSMFMVLFPCIGVFIGGAGLGISAFSHLQMEKGLIARTEAKKLTIATVCSGLALFLNGFITLIVVLASLAGN